MTNDRKRPSFLIIQLRQLGDILLTLPCARAIKQTFPDAHVSFLSHAMGKQLIEPCPCIDQAFYYRDDMTMAEWTSFLFNLRSQHFNTVFDMMSNPRSAWLSLFTRSDQRIGWRSGRGFCYQRALERNPEPVYIVQEKFRQLELLGIHSNDYRLCMSWKKERDLKPWQDFAEGLHRQASLKGRSTLNLKRGKAFHPEVVALSATHRRANRRWPADRFAALADRITTELGWAVCWLWGPGEQKEVEAIQRLCTQPSYLAPKTNLAELTAFLSQCRLFVGNSNGPSHFAVAADVPSLQLHGHTDARSWCPQTDRHRSLQDPSFFSGLPESKMNLEGLTVDQVWQTLLEMLDRA